MAWNKPGGNNDDDNNKGDKKPNNPWGSGGNQAPDFMKIITGFFDNIKKTFAGDSKPPTGGNSNAFVLPIVLIAVVLAAYAIMTSAHKIGPSERGVVLTFGEYSKTMQPGLNFTWPKPISQVYKVDVKKIFSISEEGEMLTEDKNLVFLEFDIQYRIRQEKVRDYLFKLENPPETVKHAAESAVRQVVGTNTMSHLLNENREDSIKTIVSVLQEMLDKYSSGIQVTNFNFKEVHPPADVKEAFNDVVKAREDAKTYINEAKKYAKQQIPLAEGKALEIIQQAQAYKEATITKAEGKAQEFNLVRQQYELAPDVTKERLYLETMEQVFANTSKVIMDSSNDNNVTYLPLDQIMKRSTEAKNKKPINLGTTTVTGSRKNTTSYKSDRKSIPSEERKGRL